MHKKEGDNMVTRKKASPEQSTKRMSTSKSKHSTSPAKKTRPSSTRTRRSTRSTAIPKKTKKTISTSTKTKRSTARRKTSPAAQEKVKKVMKEFKKNKLHTGSKKGPKVKSRKQAIAIALSQARKSGAKVPKKRSSE